MVLHRQVSFEEFASWPEKRPYLEYINGEVREKTVGIAAHSLTQLEMGFFLRSWAPLAFVVTEQRCLLKAGGSTAVLPDVALFPAGAFVLNAKGQAIAPPLLAVEILSPDDAYADVQEKVTVYLEAGVPLVWAVDPTARNITIHRTSGRPIVVSGGGCLNDPLLPGFSLPLKDLFSKLDSLPTLEQP